VRWDTFEVTRQYAACHNQPGASGQPAITDAARCKQIEMDYEKQRKELEGNVQNYRQIAAVMGQIIPILKNAARGDSLTSERVRAIVPTAPT
jgi:hypothetical protein